MGKKDMLQRLLIIQIMQSQRQIMELAGLEKELHTHLDLMLAKPCWQKHWR